MQELQCREKKWREKETGCSCSYMYMCKSEEEEEEKKKRKRLALKRSSFSCVEAVKIATRRDAK